MFEKNNHMKNFFATLAYVIVFNANAQTIKGVITKETDYGRIAEIGQSVFIIDANSIPDTINIENLQTFYSINKYYYNSNIYHVDYSKESKRVQKEMKKYEEKKKKDNQMMASVYDKCLKSLRVNSSEDYAKRRVKYFIDVHFIKSLLNKKQASINGIGEYSFKCDAGSYLIFIESSIPLAYYGELVSIKNQEVKEISYCFTK